MALNSATTAPSLRCCPCTTSAGASIRRSTGTRPDRVSAGLLRCSKRGNGGLNLSCAAASAAPAPKAPLPWWAKELKEEDALFFPLVDFNPAGKGREEIDAILSALLSVPLEPVLHALREIGTAGNLFRCRSFHIGTISGALLVIAGFSQLCSTAPTLFVDIVLGYMFYKLSILSAELQRNGRANNICARIQLVLIFILSFKDNNAFQGIYRILAESIWFLNVQLYFAIVFSEVTGTKHMRLFWLGVYRLLQTKGGLTKVIKSLIKDIKIEMTA
uniref:Uncharacterized protein n=1 Tax=Leersia perrieri TaxID=77586 RepID=A0A0D9WA74_9ORYZ